GRLLAALSSNTAIEYIESTVQNWVTNKIPEISRNQISPEDISLISFVRCKIFRDSLPYYTKDINLCICLMEEVNAFTSAMDNVSTRTLLTMQQELYEQAQQIAHIGNWSVEIASNSIVWSNELFRIYELEPQKTITYDLASFNHPDDAEFVREQMRISRETLQSHNFYYRIILKDGREKHLHARGQVLADENGKAEKMFGTLQDVSSQKKIEREHRENELFIQKITELTPSLIGVYNIHSGKYLFVNQAIQTMLGYKAEDVLKNGIGFFTNIVHPEDLPRIIAENNKAIEEQNQTRENSNTEEIREFRYRMRHADGHYKWFQTYGTVFERNAENKIETVINVTIDVNEQITSAGILRQNAEEIRKQEDRYYKMTEEVEDYAILLLSPKGIIENWNTGAEKIKGYKSEEIIGRNFRIFYTPEDLENKVPEKLIHEARVNGKASVEGWRVRKDQTRFWGNTVITSLHDNQGNVIGFSKVTRDLTQKKLAEDNLKMYMANLERKNRELDQKNKELESFSYIASHDLQEPIRKIRIWATRIEEAEDISNEVRDSLSRITRACIQMQKLIQGVLQYSQTELLDLPREQTDLNVIVNEVLTDLSEVIEEKKIVIETDRLPELHVVRLQFVQLFSNIIGNAIKYSREGVIPKIEIRCALLNEAGTGTNTPFYEITIS
ncbi:MAG: PAS domain-containing protein, partial [Bacteroidota bacterium]|nr:PAS domain-containing protein [Bacteroidota bacterium]